MKKTILIKFLSILVLCLLVFSFTSCGKEKNPTYTATFNITINEKFGGFNLGTSIDDFNKLGFEYGDSLNFTFSNGVEKNDVPYFNGYYSNRGGILLCAYPGYENPHLTYNNGPDMSIEVNSTKEAIKVTVTLCEKGKYKVKQDVMNITYSVDRSLYSSDEMFANYRCVTVGNIKEDRLYRGVSPVNNEYNRALICNTLITNDQINYILDLADKEENILSYKENESYKYNESYFASLYALGKVSLLGLKSDYSAEAYRLTLGNALKDMITNEAPYYVHCTEGKDRTGFVCVVLEGLCGATYEEIEADYMTTYYNYYFITKDTNLEKYNAIVGLMLYDMIKYLTGETDQAKFNSLSLYEASYNYLVDCGLNDDEINTLKDKLTLDK